MQPHLCQLFDMRGTGRSGDIDILKSWGGNSKCLSPEDIAYEASNKTEEHRVNGTNLSGEDKLFGGLVPITDISLPQYNKVISMSVKCWLTTKGVFLHVTSTV